MRLVSIIMIVMAVNLNAGPIKTALTNNPEGTLATIRAANYATLLQFIQDAYTEYKAENDDPLLESAYQTAINEASLEKQIGLALDFCLIKNDILIKQVGARMIWIATLNGANPGTEQKQAAITKLKSLLTPLTPSRESYDFARYASNALIVLGDDAGLDVFLTDKEDVSNYSSKDNWTPATLANTFQQLSDQYTQLAADPNNANNEVEKTMAAVYLRAKDRRTQSQEVKALQPIANLQTLKKF